MRKQRAFASLTEDEINQIAGWLPGGKYDEVRERIAQPRPAGFGLELKSTRPLETLWKNFCTVEKINRRLENGEKLEKLKVSDLNAIDAGDRTDFPTPASPPTGSILIPNSNPNLCDLCAHAAKRAKHNLQFSLVVNQHSKLITSHPSTRPPAAVPEPVRFSVTIVGGKTNRAKYRIAEAFGRRDDPTHPDEIYL
jgi:hypothetical protein